MIRRATNPRNLGFGSRICDARPVGDTFAAYKPNAMSFDLKLIMNVLLALLAWEVLNRLFLASVLDKALPHYEVAV